MKITKNLLRTKLPEIEVSKIRELEDIAKEMLCFVKRKNAIGMAANQVGIPRRMFVMFIDNEEFVCINPVVTKFSDKFESAEEGCLSFSGKWVEVQRPAEIEVEYFNLNGEKQSKTLNGIHARCFLHELDHLNGITMFKRKSEGK